MSLSILIVEDNRLIAFSLMSELQSVKHNVAMAHSFSEAKQLAASMKPDLIIMDVNLGDGSDGITLMNEIQDEIGEIPNIYLSGYVKEELIDRAKTTAPLTILEKPVDSKYLIKLLEDIETKG